MKEEILKAVRAWVERFGTGDQRDRFAEGVLPVEEVIDGVRAQLFAPLDGFKRWAKLRPRDVCERDTCTRRPLKSQGSPCIGKCHFSTIVLDTVRRSEFVLYRRIKGAAPDGARYEIREHRGDCDGCNCVRRIVTLAVTVDWHVWELTREYLLTK